jgi:hypothetical protein
MKRTTVRLQDGRQVVLVRGSKTQTVNVCALDYSSGGYEHVYRRLIGENVEPADLEELADAAALHDWVASRSGAEELQQDGVSGRPVLPLVDVESNAGWLKAATTAVEKVLDDVTTSFLASPYLHRVEHSLHAELYAHLKNQAALRDEYTLRTSETTQLVHKEWPETVLTSAPELAGSVALSTWRCCPLRDSPLPLWSSFRQGRITAPIVIEVGLDYGRKHLEDDGKKMLDSDVLAPYLLHLSRVPDVHASAIEAYVTAPPGQLRVAYVHHDPRGGTRYKRLSDTGVSAV